MSDKWDSDNITPCEIRIPKTPEEVREMFPWAYEKKIQPDIIICSKEELPFWERFIEDNK